MITAEEYNPCFEKWKEQWAFRLSKIRQPDLRSPSLRDDIGAYGCFACNVASDALLNLQWTEQDSFSLLADQVRINAYPFPYEKCCFCPVDYSYLLGTEKKETTKGEIDSCRSLAISCGIYGCFMPKSRYMQYTNCDRGVEQAEKLIVDILEKTKWSPYDEYVSSHAMRKERLRKYISKLEDAVWIKNGNKKIIVNYEDVVCWDDHSLEGNVHHEKTIRQLIDERKSEYERYVGKTMSDQRFIYDFMAIHWAYYK